MTRILHRNARASVNCKIPLLAKEGRPAGRGGHSRESGNPLRLALLLMAAFLAASPASAQIATGIPPFASMAPSSFDMVNESNNNVIFSIPIVNKGGRGMPFTYSLVYNSSVWSGYTAWTPSPSWGWGGASSTNPGYTGAQWYQGSCTDLMGFQFYWDIWHFTWYYDSSGAMHQIVYQGGSGVWLSDYDQTGADCAGDGYPSSATVTTGDGSGYTLVFNLDASYGFPVAKVYSRSGNWGNAYPLGYNVGGSSVGDTNGNTQSYSISSGTTTYTDTLGATALTAAAGSGSNTYTYTGLDGNSHHYTVYYTQQTVRTNFGCSGISEYGPTSQYLVSSIVLPDSTSYSFSYEPTPGYSGDVTGRLYQVTLPTGGTIAYTYSGGSQGITCADGTTATLTRTLNPGGGGAQEVWTYAHTENSTTSWSTTVTDPAQNQTIIQFVASTYGGFTFPGAFEAQRKVYSGSSTLMETVDTCYNSASIPCTGSVSLPISNRTVQTTLPNPSSPSQTYTAYNSYTLPTEVDEYNFGPTLARKTLISYASLSNTHIQNRPSDVQIKDSGNNVKAHSAYGYDGNGNLTSETLYTGGTPSTITRSFTYNSYGVLQTATDFLNSTSQEVSVTGYMCGSSNAFPSTITLPASLSGSINWNCSVGLPNSMTDVNSNTTSFSYDSMVRATGTSYPGGGSVSTTYTSATQIDFYTAIVGSTQRNDRAILDGLGRVTRNVLVNDPDPNGATYVDTSYGYNSTGRTVTVSNPYRGSSSPGGDTSQSDALNRVNKVTHVDNSYSQMTYGGGTSQSCAASTYGYGYSTVYTDEVGHQRQTFTDALGRVIEADEPNSGGSLSVYTCYKYDVLNDLTEVDQGSETRSYIYDMLGRLTQATTPEAKGNTRYFYYTTSGGALCSGDPSAVCRRTDERAITTAYTYDALNRVTGISYSNNDPTSISYTYDQTSCLGLSGSCYNHGQRTTMSDASGSTQWAYDAMGRVLREHRTIGSVTKNIDYTYNLDGSLATVTYPSGRTVTYSPSAVGRPVWAKDTGNSINYVTSATYAPHGALATAAFGSSITFSALYNNRLLPYDLKGQTSSTFFELEPSYNTNGTVSGVTNALTSGRTQSFTYDYLNRIITAQSAANSGTYCWGQSIPTDGTGYDRYGNLLKINVSQCSAPSLNVSVNAYNQITNSGYSYDASGNMLTDGSTNSYTWNGEGMQKSTGTVNYTFDGDGKRVEKSSGTYYWFSPDGIPLAETDSSGNTQNEYIYFSTGRTARRDSAGNIYYYFGDHLGAARLITNASGTVCYDADFTPFGSEMAYTTTCAQNYKFAGMERDSETGNDHTWFRPYEQNLGRLMSPDLLGGDVTNPQSLNRYAYVLNNPTTLTDPFGLDGDCGDPYYAASHAECPGPGACNPMFGCYPCYPTDPFCNPVGGGGIGGGGDNGPSAPTIPIPGNADFGGSITCTQSSTKIGGVSYPGGPITCTITLSPGVFLPNININDLLAALDSAYGAALGKAGQAFRGRPPGQSYSACIAQNASRTLTLSPSHSSIIGASALTAMVGLGSYLKQVPVGGGSLPASFVWLARGIGAAAGAVGVPGTEAVAGYVLGAAAGLSNAGAVLGSAGFGVLVGSAANCISEGVNP